MDKLYVDNLLAGADDLALRLEAFNWSSTGLGPYETWPASLRSVAAMVLENRFPMTLWWGPDLLHIYNEAYLPVLADKHPHALGQPAAEIWQEIWHIIGPQSEYVLCGKGATWNEHLFLPMNRKGFIEETYFTFSYSPVRDDAGGIGGVLVTCQETTLQVQSERQLLLLRDLGAQPTPESAEEACNMATLVLARNDADFPFAMLYLIDADGQQASLVASAGLDDYQGPGTPEVIIFDKNNAQTWPLAEASADSPLVLNDVLDKVGTMPGGRWEQPPEQAVVVVLTGSGSKPYGYLVVGLSPLRAFDDAYQELIRLTADQIDRAIGSARAYEEERKRVEALAELDRAKTAFFLNVSHELRTPLTLMLAPTEDALRAAEPVLAPTELKLVHRNALRMLKLVNTLLDFSRIEAGRTDVSFKATNLSLKTQELASTFRSAIEKAGLSLVADMPELDELVYIDEEKWEKIVLNLLSNALKFTFEGSIRIALRRVGSKVELQVQDTGIGIVKEELPHIFDRFHRVKNARGRTHEGTGIGLSLVRELVKLHGGNINVQSSPGAGTTFTIRLPFGSEHLPQEQISSPQKLASTAIGVRPYIEEALRWLPESPDTSWEWEVPATEGTSNNARAGEHGQEKPCVLVADDNADMRDYLRRLLESYWTVEAVSDGEAALQRVLRSPPDLVLTDVMMPKVDGFELLQQLRGNELTKSIPVILLSARAGDEARLEGLEAGADDYLVKPFSARELTTRIAACLELARVRREAAEALSEANARLKQEDRRKDEFLAMLAHELRNPLGAISNTVQLMELHCDTANRRYLNILTRQSSILQGLVNDLLDVSRITRGLVEIKREQTDLVQIAAHALESVRPLMEDNDHVLSLALPDEPLYVIGDTVRLEQILVNLLTNSAKYTDPGGMITLELACQRDQAVLRVKDTGIGMTLKYWSRCLISSDRSNGGWIVPKADWGLV
ncbi:response regulator [Salinimonas marina]|uniref:histidine kinase n=1 Tax=Salinimonas marina TaxID=2785918 RepID=A0A7S9DYB4_9ALTE|nr:response regulator [Salinimonas marina]